MRKIPFEHNYRETNPFNPPRHLGVDIVAQNELQQDELGAPVLAMEDGIVEFIWHWTGTLQGNDIGGNFIIIRSGDRHWYYGHLKDIQIDWGESIHEGDVLGHQGNTGYVTGEHLHFELRLGTYWKLSVPTSPWVFLNAYEQTQNTYMLYTVRAGDTLWKIAERFLGDGSRWPEIKGYTGDPSKLPTGTVLRIPTGDTYFDYIMKAGDTLWALADRFLGNGGRWKEIKGYTGDPARIPVGTKVIIPRA